MYTLPTEDNTFSVSGIVESISINGRRKSVFVNMTNGNEVRIVYSLRIQETGYDLEQLVNLLEGNFVECQRLEQLTWATELRVGDTVIDLLETTTRAIKEARVGGIILFLLILAMIVLCDVEYLRSQYAHYKRTQKKLAKKARRELEKAMKEKYGA